MSLLRKIVFYIFTLIYLVFCPVLILYALGYFYAPGPKAGLIKTGLVYATTVPPGATVHMNENHLSDPTPTMIRDLLPGDYELSLSLEGYRPWKRAIPIEAGKATTLEHVLLLPSEWQFKKLAAGPYERFFPFDGGNRFLLTAGEETGDHFIYDLNEAGVYPVFSAENPAEFVAHYFIPKEDSGFILKTDTGTRSRYYRVLFEEEPSWKDISPLFPQEASRLIYPEDSLETFFAYTGRQLNRVDVKKGAVHPAVVRDVRGAGVWRRRLYVLRDPGQMIKTDDDGDVQRLLMDDAALYQELFAGSDFWQIHILDRAVFLFLSSGGGLINNHLPYRLVEKEVEGIELFRKEKKALLWTSEKIGVLSFKERDPETRVFETGPRVQWVYDGGSRIEQAFWLYEGSHVVFRDGNRVYLLEVEGYGKPHVEFLFEVNEKSGFFYSEETGEAYFLAPDTRDFISVEILPKRKIIFLPFPEIEEERKKKAIEES